MSKTNVQEEYPEFNCLDCEASTMQNGEYYMIHNWLWIQANPKDSGMLCIGCLEARLGRKLTKYDFTDAPVNHVNQHSIMLYKSKRLVNRLLSN